MFYEKMIVSVDCTELSQYKIFHIAIFSMYVGKTWVIASRYFKEAVRYKVRSNFILSHMLLVPAQTDMGCD